MNGSAASCRSTVACFLVLTFLANARAPGQVRDEAVQKDDGTSSPVRFYECKERDKGIAEPPPILPPMVQARRGKRISIEAAKNVRVQPLCPAGQVPIPRAWYVPKGNAFYSPTAVDAPYNYAGEFSSTGGEERLFDGAGVVTVVEDPAISDAAGTHSLFEISVQGGTGNGDIVEIGWTKNRGDKGPHLFVFHWIDWNPQCYNGCGWVQWNSSIVPGMELTVGSQTYMGWVFYEPQGNWWAWYGNQWVGYFPGARWRGSYKQSNLVQWFGEVYEEDPTPASDMGNGLKSVQPPAARFWFPCEVDSAAWVCWINPNPALNQPSLPWYDVRNVGGFAHRYGGPGGRSGPGRDP